MIHFYCYAVSLASKIRATFSSNDSQDQKPFVTRLHARTHAQRSIFIYLLRVLIGLFFLLRWLCLVSFGLNVAQFVIVTQPEC